MNMSVLTDFENLPKNHWDFQRDRNLDLHPSNYISFDLDNKSIELTLAFVRLSAMRNCVYCFNEKLCENEYWDNLVNTFFISPVKRLRHSNFFFRFFSKIKRRRVSCWTFFRFHFNYQYTITAIVHQKRNRLLTPSHTCRHVFATSFH